MMETVKPKLVVDVKLEPSTKPRWTLGGDLFNFILLIRGFSYILVQTVIGLDCHGFVEDVLFSLSFVFN